MSQLAIIIESRLGLLYRTEQNNPLHIVLHTRESIMKHTLVLLSLCLAFTFTVTTEITKPASNQQPHTGANVQHPVIHPSVLADQKSHLNSTAPVHHPQVNSINDHHAINHSHPTDLRPNPYEQAHFHNTPISHDPARRIAVAQRQTKRAIHPRFRPLFQYPPKTKGPLPTTAPQITPSTSLLPIHTGKPLDHHSHTLRSPLFGDYYYQQQLRAFFRHHHDEHSHPPRRTRGWIKTGLRR